MRRLPGAAEGLGLWGALLFGEFPLWGLSRPVYRKLSSSVRTGGDRAPPLQGNPQSPPRETVESWPVLCYTFTNNPTRKGVLRL